MTERWATSYGTERDKVNCSFYQKIGACRHGSSCSRRHTRPEYSVTVLIPNLYVNPQQQQQQNQEETAKANAAPSTWSAEQLQQHFDLFYEDLFIEFSLKYGKVHEMVVCDNISDHLMGNVYVSFEDERVAEKAVADLNRRWYNHRPVFAELSPVTDFRESCCKQFEQGTCDRGGYCNFMHIKYPTRDLKKELWASASLTFSR